MEGGIFMSKISNEDKIYYCQQYLEGKITQGQIAQATGLKKSSVYMWINKYEAMGAEAFLQVGNKRYSKELKVQAVQEYLSGESSQYNICKKYEIKSTTQLQRWIFKYNSHEELKTSGTGGNTIMTKGRRTTFDERIEIVKYCIENNHNYAKTSEKYQVSYQQARNYTVKYETGGIEALIDKRGKRKSEDEMTELERLRAENKILRAEKQRAEMEASFLKKLDEIERRRG